MNRATYLKLLAHQAPAAPCIPSSPIVGLEAAVSELKSKIADCNSVEGGMGVWKLSCGPAANRMVSELRSRSAFSGCKRKQLRVNKRLWKSITHAGEKRCCVVQYVSDLPDIIAKLRDAVNDGFLIVASVLSGGCTGQGGRCSDRTCCDVPGPRAPFPDHWILIIGHDGANKFVFWDPDTFASNATRFCAGFGYLFFDAAAGRFSTAAKDSEMEIPAGKHTSPARGGEPRIGINCCLSSVSSPQHRYQVLQVISV
jgi:hypothetical protein